jgi:hypothetical protein
MMLRPVRLKPERERRLEKSNKDSKRKSLIPRESICRPLRRIMKFTPLWFVAYVKLQSLTAAVLVVLGEHSLEACRAA